MSFGGNQSGQGSQRPFYQPNSQPIGAAELYASQSSPPGSSNYQQTSTEQSNTYQHSFSQQDNRYQRFPEQPNTHQRTFAHQPNQRTFPDQPNTYQPTFAQPNTYQRSFAEQPNTYQRTFPEQPYTHQRTFSEQPNLYQGYQGNNERPRSRTPPIPPQLNIPSRDYMQTLEQEFVFASRRNRDYETTILQLANLLCQSPLVTNQSQNIPTHSSNPVNQIANMLHQVPPVRTQNLDVPTHSPNSASSPTYVPPLTPTPAASSSTVQPQRYEGAEEEKGRLMREARERIHRNAPPDVHQVPPVRNQNLYVRTHSPNPASSSASVPPPTAMATSSSDRPRRYESAEEEKRRIREERERILHVHQVPSVRNQNLDVPRTFRRTPSPSGSPHQFPSTSGAQDENPGMPPPDYTEHPFDPQTTTLLSVPLSPPPRSIPTITASWDSAKVRYTSTPAPSQPYPDIERPPPFSPPTPLGSRSEKANWSVEPNTASTSSQSAGYSAIPMSPSSRPNPPSSSTSTAYRSEKNDWLAPTSLQPTASITSIHPPSRPNPPSTPMSSRPEKADWLRYASPSQRTGNSVISTPPPSRPNLLSPHSSKGPLPTRPEWSVEYNSSADRSLEVNLLRTITNEQGAFHIKFSPDGQLLAVVACKGQIVTIYKVATGAKICQLEDLYVRKDPPSTQDLSFSPNGKYLATSTEDPENIIRIWDVRKKYVRNVLRGHHHGILSLDFSHNGRFLISGSSDGTVRIWNMRSGSSRVFNHSSTYICALRFSPDGKQVAGGSFNGDVFLWEVRSGRLVASMTGHTEAVSSIVFMPKGEGFISGSRDGSLKYWNNTVSSPVSDRKEDEKPKVSFFGNTGEILSVSIPPHGQWIASGSFDRKVGIWNTRTGAQQCVLQAHAEHVYSVDCSPAGDHLASADWKGTVRVWSYKKQPLIRPAVGTVRSRPLSEKRMMLY